MKTREREHIYRIWIHAYCNNLLCPNVCQAIAFSKTECQSSKTTGAGFGPSHDLAQSKVQIPVDTEDHTVELAI